MAAGTEVTIGFEGLEEKDPKSYTVQFSASDPEPDIQQKSEEIVLLERTGESPERRESTKEEKEFKSQTIYFEDGERQIDFVLSYQVSADKKKKGRDDPDSPVHVVDIQDKRKPKRDRFIESCEELGLEFELQDCSESPDRKTYFIKVHANHLSLLRGAEDLLIRMPIKPNNLKVSSYRERFFDFLKVRDPFQPKIPEHLVRDVFFTAPFKLERKENFINWDDEKNFFTTAQRSAIVWSILQNGRYGDDEDQVGILRLQQNNTFNNAYPLHESSPKFDPKKDDETTMTDRQLLHTQWSFWKNWYKRQPLDQIRRYFGEKIGIYFAWLGFYTTWLLPASIVGIIVMIYGLSTINRVPSRNPIAAGTCDEESRYDLFMCPRCDLRCDFWFYKDGCNFAYVAQLFDNGATVFFAIFMSLWAVLFLEFWKRRQYYLQYDWDVLGYEDTEQRARPEFEQEIKRHIRKCKSDKAKEKFYIWNPVLEKREYIQPQYWLTPKILLTVSILFTMVMVVIGIVISVLLYRLVVARAIYAIVANISNGPSVGDIAVSISGACIQLVAIIVMNKIYEFLAYKLTLWELHRTPTDFEDNFISKMYLFQFVNFYTSLFYIAFVKGRFSGQPGSYNRDLGGLRLEECATYGCLLELTIQLGIIFLGKQILNNVTEISIPYVKRFINWVKHKEETDEDVYTRWEKDFDLIPLTVHGLFYEYLELVIQYGFVTLFVAAFPLAPLFALINNWFEIRIDAHKFVSVLRRPVPERAQDMGAWYGILDIISKFSIVTNAFIIAVTAEFIPLLVYQYGSTNTGGDGLDGFVNWSLSEFNVKLLVDGEGFPAYTALDLNLRDMDGNSVKNTSSNDDYIYMPFIDSDCLETNAPDIRPPETVVLLDNQTVEGFIKDLAFQTAYLRYVFDTSNLTCNDSTSTSMKCDTISPPADTVARCFNNQATCRFRGYVNNQGDAQGVKFWQVQAVRLAFVIAFEHFIVLIVGVLAWLVPDVPQSVKNEIQREKLLAYEAVYARREETGVEKEIAAELAQSHSVAEEQQF